MQSNVVPLASVSISSIQDELMRYVSLSTDSFYRLSYATMRYDFISGSITRLLGYTPDEFQNLSVRNIILETRMINDAMRPLGSFMMLEEHRKRGAVGKWQADYLMRCKDGSTRWIADISYPWCDSQGYVMGAIGVLRDISERYEAQLQAQQKAAESEALDSLTKLPTRRVFFGMMEYELQQILRNHQVLSLMLVKMDDFHAILERFGPVAADELLCDMANLLKHIIRITDSAARLEGCIFALLLPETEASGAYKLRERIRTAYMREIIKLGDKRHMLGSSVSFSIVTARSGHPMDANTLFEEAYQKLLHSDYASLAYKLMVDDSQEVH